MIFWLSVFGGVEHHLRNFKAPDARRLGGGRGGRIQKVPRGGLHKVRHNALYAEPNRPFQKGSEEA